MKSKLKIKHQTGSKAGQVEEFAAGDALKIGRSNSCRIQYDPGIDDMVSREHASISAGGSAAPPAKQGAGRETLQRMIVTERKKSKTGMMLAAAGILA
jgi:hypothetical protein